MPKCNNGVDMVARATAGFNGAAYMSGSGGLGSITGTSVSLTSVTGPTGSTGGPPHNTGVLIGMVITTGTVYGVILQHTAGPPAVITVDQWYNPASASGATGTTPSTGSYVISPGSFPAVWMGLTTATRTIPSAPNADAFLTNDGTTISEVWNSGGGLNRAMPSFAHTVGTTTLTLTKTFTSTVSDPSSSTLNRIGLFCHAVNAAPSTTTTGVMLYETNLSAQAIITNNTTDNVTVTETVTIS
jgi:hypothetical protein